MSLNTLLIYQLQQVFQHTVKINRKKRLFEFFFIKTSVVSLYTRPSSMHVT